MGKEGIPEKEKKRMSGRFREVRNDAKMSQERFAEELDLTVSAVKKIELGEIGVSRDVLWKLNQKFDVSADYILFGKTSDKNQLWKLFLNSSEIDKKAFLERLFAYASKISYGLNVKDEM